MRTLTSACAVTVAAAASMLLGPAAYATTHGDNGTVKIHDAKTGVELPRNEPHPGCTFYLDAFGFDGGQLVNWQIVQMPPTGTKGTLVKKGANLKLESDGTGRSENLSLPSGHYKLNWTFNGEHGEGKHKVFWTECEGGGEAGGQAGGPTGKPTNTPVPGSKSESPAPGKSVKGGEENLAETGASVVGASVTAVALLGAGGWLMLRRRASGRS